MSFIDFAIELGRNLFSTDDDAAEKIKTHIEADNPGIRNLGVDFQKGFVTLSGEADSVEAVEKAMLMAGNVKGVGKVVSNIVLPSSAGGSPAVVPGGGGSQGSKVEFYVIQKGDTLSAVAQRYYGKASEYPRLFEANREVIKDPDKIFVGQKIRIPLD